MNGYALDSNIITFRMKRNETVKRNLTRAIQAGNIIRIPPFAYYEVKRGYLAIGATGRLRKFDALCQEYPVGGSDDRVIEEAAVIYAGLKARGWNIDAMDIFIAAWCRVNDFTLVTNNTTHFAQIPGLPLPAPPW